MTNIYHKHVLISNREVNARSIASLNDDTKEEDEEQDKKTKNKESRYNKNQ